MNIINVFKDIKFFLLGKKQYTFYFQTLTFGDSLLSLWFLLLQLLGIKSIRKSRELFLDEVDKLFKFKKGFLFGSARSSLFALLKTLNYDKGSEVLVTGFTCEVVPNAVINAGYIPIYVDINTVNYCMDSIIAEKLITKKTKVIIIQHTFGIPAQIEELIGIAKKHDLYIIEDCAVSLGSKYKGKLTGTFGDASIFSFELSKTITSCWGGMLLLNTNKDNVIEKMKEFYEKVPEQKRYQHLKALFQLGISGILYRPSIYIIGKYLITLLFKLKIFSPSTSFIETEGGLSENYLVKLSNEQIKIVHRQYLRLDKLVEQKVIVKNKFLDVFSDILDNKYKKLVSKNDVTLLRFPMLTDDRSRILDWFEFKNIELGFWFTAPLSSKTIDHKVFKYSPGSCPNSELISKNIINLPLSEVTAKIIITSNLMFK
jgi:perosamine synthetase